MVSEILRRRDFVALTEGLKDWIRVDVDYSLEGVTMLGYAFGIGSKGSDNEADDELIAFLESRGADVNATPVRVDGVLSGVDPVPIIFEAMRVGDVDAVTTLLAHGAVPFQRDGNGSRTSNSILHYYSRNRFVHRLHSEMPDPAGRLLAALKPLDVTLHSEGPDGLSPFEVAAVRANDLVFEEFREQLRLQHPEKACRVVDSLFLPLCRQIEAERSLNAEMPAPIKARWQSAFAALLDAGGDPRGYRKDGVSAYDLLRERDLADLLSLLPAFEEAE